MPRPFEHIVNALRLANGLAAKKSDDPAREDDEPAATDEDDKDDRETGDDRPKKSKRKKEDAEGNEPRDEDVDEDSVDQPKKQKDSAAVAEMILAAGAKRRGERPATATRFSDLPTDRIARNILLSGMYRRAEISFDEYNKLKR